jgi:hypothetical protein
MGERGSPASTRHDDAASAKTDDSSKPDRSIDERDFMAMNLLAMTWPIQR